MEQRIEFEKSQRQGSRSRSPRSMADRPRSRWRDIFPEDMAARPPSDWRDTFSEESLAPLENTQD
eukprot:3939897-Pyramimonas_sp.AAC.1